MLKKTYRTLEFDKVLNMLEEKAISEKVRSRIRNLEPYLSEADVKRHLSETTEARQIIELSGTPPLSVMNDLEKHLAMADKGTFLLPEDLCSIAQFLTACRRMKSYLKKSESTSSVVALYGNSIHDLSDVADEINRIVRGNVIDDRASPRLSDIRRKIVNSGDMIKSKLDSLLRNNKEWFSEGFVALRNGHYTLPVRKEYKSRVNGSVFDVSQSGSTYFIEPASAGKLLEEMSLLHIEEENEVRRILFMLTALVDEHMPLIKINIEAMETLDFIFAKAKLSISMKAMPLPVSTTRKIEIKSGRHPLLKAETVIPLDFVIGGDISGVVITGPNTGGKTVALKTTGLLSLMAQSGLHVPAAGGCFAMNNYVLCDIGDGQSISENLSTFSSHMTNVIEILRLADDQSLVLLDELGSGTDPAEGMGIAVAILEELAKKRCLFIATTHYPEIKDYAKASPGLVNARMAFDRRSLMPLYQLEIGEAGESCALYIARRLGFPSHMITRARAAAYGTRNDSDEKMYEKAEEEIHPDNITPFQQAGIKNESHPLRIKAQEIKKAPENSRSMRFNIGDSVIIYPQKMIGIVYQKADEKGEIGVQLKKNKLLINHKRLKLYIPADELYPEGYDFSIIFDSVATRKAHKEMESKHNPDLIIKIEK